MYDTRLRICDEENKLRLINFNFNSRKSVGKRK